MDYQNKVVVLTGAAKGIGNGLAREFAARGSRLALADFNRERLQTLAEELQAGGTEVLSMQLDVSSYDQTSAFCNKVYDTYGHVDYLINNAGVTSIGHILRLPLDNWHRTFEVNTLGLVNAIKTFANKMVAQDTECYFINTCSNSALAYTNALIPAYAASKAAATSLTHSLAVAMIRMNAKMKVICHSPGSVATEICMPDKGNLDRSDPYFSTEEFKRVNEACTNIIAAGMTVDAYSKAFFEHLENGDYFIRPCLDEEPIIQAYAKGIVDRMGPYDAK